MYTDPFQDCYRYGYRYDPSAQRFTDPFQDHLQHVHRLLQALPAERKLIKKVKVHQTLYATGYHNPKTVEDAGADASGVSTKIKG